MRSLTVETKYRTRAAAAFGLAGSNLALPEYVLPSWEWRQLVTSAQLNRVTGLLAGAVASGRLPTTEQQNAEMHRMHADMMGICLRLEQDLLRVSALFEDVGVPMRVLKGPSFAHLDYPDPAQRFFGDIDLLVPGEAFDDAVAVLTDRGYRRHYGQVRPGYDRRFSKGVSLTGAEQREIDLHRTFAMGPFGLTVDLSAIWSSPPEHFVLAGRRLAALDPEMRFLHACYHAALGRHSPELVPLRDLAGMAQRAPNELDMQRTHRIATSWRAEAVVARAVRAAWDAFDLAEDELSSWARDFRPSRRDARAMRTYVDPAVGFAARSFEAVRAVPGIGAKTAYVWALAFPHPSYGAGRHRGHARRWGNAAREVIHVLRRGPAR